MKTHFISFLWVLLAIVACNQSNNNTDNSDSVDQEIDDKDSVVVEKSTLVLSEVEQCYTANVKTDSAFLSLKQNNDKIDGRLWYKFAEKDNSKGKLNGYLKNDTLTLNYIFNAEGSTSEMPIKLFYKEGKFYEVHNNVVNDSENGFIYSKSDCKEF